MEILHQKKEVIDFLNLYAKNPIGFLLLSGKNGTGKSFAAMSIYNIISPYKLPAYDADLAIFINQAELNLAWNKENAERGQTFFMLEQYCKTKLLIIDDLGTRIPSDAFMDFLYAIADARYNARGEKGTIITTNLTAKDIREKLGDAFFSRIASGKSFRFDGDDRRLKPIAASLNDPSRL